MAPAGPLTTPSISGTLALVLAGSFVLPCLLVAFGVVERSSPPVGVAAVVFSFSAWVLVLFLAATLLRHVPGLGGVRPRPLHRLLTASGLTLALFGSVMANLWPSTDDKSSLVGGWSTASLLASLPAIVLDGALVKAERVHRDREDAATARRAQARFDSWKATGQLQLGSPDDLEARLASGHTLFAALFDALFDADPAFVAQLASTVDLSRAASRALRLRAEQLSPEQFRTLLRCAGPQGFTGDAPDFSPLRPIFTTRLELLTVLAEVTSDDWRASRAPLLSAALFEAHTLNHDGGVRLLERWLALGGDVCALDRPWEGLRPRSATSTLGCAEGQSNVFHLVGQRAALIDPLAWNAPQALSVIRALLERDEASRRLLQQRDAAGRTPAEALAVWARSLERDRLSEAQLQGLDALHQAYGGQGFRSAPITLDALLRRLEHVRPNRQEVAQALGTPRPTFEGSLTVNADVDAYPFLFVNVNEPHGLFATLTLFGGTHRLRERTENPSAWSPGEDSDTLRRAWAFEHLEIDAEVRTSSAGPLEERQVLSSGVRLTFTPR